MATSRSFPTQVPTGTPLTDTRRALSGLVVRNADGTPRPGVLPGSASPIVTGRASMGYDVAPFLAATSRINTGIELIANDAVTVVPTIAAPASNSRIDVIWVRSQFMQHADANNDVVFGVAQGTAAAIPSKPTVPPGALELATAEILSTTTTTATVVITQTFQCTAAAGGVVLVRSLAERNAWAAAEGSMVRVLASGLEFRRSASPANEWLSTPGAHAEFTGTVTVNDGGLASLPVMAVDSSKATDSSFVTPVAGGFTVRPGVYAVTVSTGVGIAATGRCFIDVDGERVAWATAPENNLAGTGQVRASADTTFTVSIFQTSGAARNMPTRVKITKVG